MIKYFKDHWDVGATTGAILATISASKVNAAIELTAALLTTIFVACRVFVWLLKARMTWRNRNNTAFFEKNHDDE